MFKTIVTATALFAATAASAQLVVTRDFDNPNFTAAGVTAVSSAGGGAVTGSASISGFGANFFRNDTNGQWQMALSNLPTHTSVTIDIDLAFIDSWDSTNGSPAPDLLIWSIDGVDIAQLTANNASGSVNFFAGGTVTQGPANLGFSSWNDRIVDMSTSTLATFAHTGSTLTFGLRFGGAGYQGGLDESWGFDNLAITLSGGNTGVPEPASWAMLIAGFGLTGAAMRRRRAVVA
jgi:hypothetical protein